MYLLPMQKTFKSSWKWNKISISRKKITLHLCLKKCCKRCLQTLVKYIIQWQQHLILEERTPLQRMTNLRAGAGLLLATTVMTYHIIKQEDTSIFYNTHVRPLFTQGWLKDWCHPNDFQCVWMGGTMSSRPRHSIKRLSSQFAVKLSCVCLMFDYIKKLPIVTIRWPNITLLQTTVALR